MFLACYKETGTISRCPGSGHCSVVSNAVKNYGRANEERR